MNKIMLILILVVMSPNVVCADRPSYLNKSYNYGFKVFNGGYYQRRFSDRRNKYVPRRGPKYASIYNYPPHLYPGEGSRGFYNKR